MGQVDDVLLGDRDRGAGTVRIWRLVSEDIGGRWRGREEEEEDFG